MVYQKPCPNPVAFPRKLHPKLFISELEAKRDIQAPLVNLHNSFGTVPRN